LSGARPGAALQSAAELAEALQGCQDHRRMEKDLPRGGLITRVTLRHPLLVGLALIVVPHVFGSVVNISYNSVRIVDNLTPAQQSAFSHLILIYNALAYPLCVWLMVRLLVPLIRVWRQLSGPDIPTMPRWRGSGAVCLRLPVWTRLPRLSRLVARRLSLPFALDRTAGPIDAEVYAHFMISFTISGLIALTYSLLGVQFLVLRVLYPRLWSTRAGCATIRAPSWERSTGGWDFPVAGRPDPAGQRRPAGLRRGVRGAASSSEELTGPGAASHKTSACWSRG